MKLVGLSWFVHLNNPRTCSERLSTPIQGGFCGSQRTRPVVLDDAMTPLGGQPLAVRPCNKALSDNSCIDTLSILYPVLETRLQQCGHNGSHSKHINQLHWPTEYSRCGFDNILHWHVLLLRLTVLLFKMCQERAQ